MLDNLSQLFILRKVIQAKCEPSGKPRRGLLSNEAVDAWCDEWVTINAKSHGTQRKLPNLESIESVDITTFVVDLPEYKGSICGDNIVLLAQMLYITQYIRPDYVVRMTMKGEELMKRVGNCAIKYTNSVLTYKDVTLATHEPEVDWTFARELEIAFKRCHKSLALAGSYHCVLWAVACTFYYPINFDGSYIVNPATILPEDNLGILAQSKSEVYSIGRFGGAELPIPCELIEYWNAKVDSYRYSDMTWPERFLRINDVFDHVFPGDELHDLGAFQPALRQVLHRQMSNCLVNGYEPRFEIELSGVIRPCFAITQLTPDTCGFVGGQWITLRYFNFLDDKIHGVCAFLSLIAHGNSRNVLTWYGGDSGMIQEGDPPSCAVFANMWRDTLVKSSILKREGLMRERTSSMKERAFAMLPQSCRARWLGVVRDAPIEEGDDSVYECLLFAPWNSIASVARRAELWSDLMDEREDRLPRLCTTTTPVLGLGIGFKRPERYSFDAYCACTNFQDMTDPSTVWTCWLNGEDTYVYTTREWNEWVRTEGHTIHNLPKKYDLPNYVLGSVQDYRTEQIRSEATEPIVPDDDQ